MLAEWHMHFPGCEPVAHRLREAFSCRWVRFHRLPGSKRYPETDAEYATVLDRQNRILDELAGPETRVVLLTTEYSWSAEPTPDRPELRALDAAAKPWRSVLMHDQDFIEPCFWHLFASEWEWRPGVLDPILRLVADDIVANVMVVDPNGRWLHHPYDGGMDVILESSEARNLIKSAHADWLSSRSDGM